MDDINSVRLPRVVVTASAADGLTARLTPAQSETVTVYARAVANSSKSFANRLVERLVQVGYTRMQLKGASQQLQADIKESVEAHPQMSLF